MSHAYFKIILNAFLVVDATTTTIENVEQTAATADNLIEPALEESVIPAIDIATDIAVATGAVCSAISFSAHFRGWMLILQQSSRPSALRERSLSPQAYVCITNPSLHLPRAQDLSD